MKRRISGILPLSFLLLFSGITAARAQSDAERQMLDLVNHERAKARLNRLEWNDRLAAGALAHSKLLADRKELSHQFSGEPSLPERLGATGARLNSVAENVAEAPEVESAHDALMQSPGHRANILNPDYNAVGISIVQRGDELYVTQDFAHLLPSYTEKELRDAVVNGFNRARRARRLPKVEIISDARLRRAACAQDMNTDKMIQNLPGAASLLVFPMAEPGTLPDDLRKAAGDKTLERMNLGVCLQTGGKTGFSKFWVAAALYRTTVPPDSGGDSPPLH